MAIRSHSQVRLCNAMHPKPLETVQPATADEAAQVFSKDRLKQQQSEDAVIEPVRRWILSPDLAPTESDLRTMDPDIQDLYAQRATLEVKDGVLYHQFLRATGEIDYYQVVVP